LLALHFHHCWEHFFCPTRRKTRGVVILHKRLTTQWGEKSAPALWVAPEKIPLGVARSLFGITKLRASRLDWHFFRHNRDENEAPTNPGVSNIINLILNQFKLLSIIMSLREAERRSNLAF
jgi:hypothetical protein